MDERAMIEKAARVICAERWSGNDDAWPSYQAQARAVVAALRHVLEDEIMERCARLCDQLGHELQVSDGRASEAELITSINEAVGAQRCAQAIRALPTSRSEERGALRRCAQSRCPRPSRRSSTASFGASRWRSLWPRWRLGPAPGSVVPSPDRALT